MRSWYRDRSEAGRILAEHVADSLPDPARPMLVLALPRGGVPVAAAVASRLSAPLDVITVRKVGTPGHVELAIGAVASGGLVVLNQDLVARLGVDEGAVRGRIDIARQELADRDRRLRGDRAPPELRGRTIVLVDDGLATGASMRAAVAAVRTASPDRIVVAVPVGPPDTVEELGALADQVVCPLQPPEFVAVGQWYRDFGETTDADVVELLARHGV